MMIPTPQKILLVEGAQDREVVYHLSNHERIPKNLVEVVDRKGYENLVDTLEVDVKRSGIVQLGIVVDADLDIQTRWDSLRSRLGQNHHRLRQLRHRLGQLRPPRGVGVRPDPECRFGGRFGQWAGDGVCSIAVKFLA